MTFSCLFFFLCHACPPGEEEGLALDDEVPVNGGVVFAVVKCSGLLAQAELENPAGNGKILGGEDGRCHLDGGEGRKWGK